jgi:hypothetical protein
MAYNFNKKTCDRCGITEEEAKKYPVETGINHPFYNKTTSFFLGIDGSVTCARCHGEKELEDLFRVLDKKEREEG